MVSPITHVTHSLTSLNSPISLTVDSDGDTAGTGRYAHTYIHTYIHTYTSYNIYYCRLKFLSSLAKYFHVWGTHVRIYIYISPLKMLNLGKIFEVLVKILFFSVVQAHSSCDDPV